MLWPLVGKLKTKRQEIGIRKEIVHEAKIVLVHNSMHSQKNHGRSITVCTHRRIMEFGYEAKITSFCTVCSHRRILWNLDTKLKIKYLLLNQGRLKFHPLSQGLQDIHCNCNCRLLCCQPTYTALSRCYIMLIK